MVSQIAASRLYNEGRACARWGAQELEKGLKEKKAGHFFDALNSLNWATKYYDDATAKYKVALRENPTKCFQKKIATKKNGLEKCDFACAKKALENVKLKVEPPMTKEPQQPVLTATFVSRFSNDGDFF